MLFVRVLFSTCLVLGLIWYVARSIRQPKGMFSKLRLPSTSSMVESRAALNRTTALVVVRFGEERLLVAANDTSVSVLATSPVEAAATDPVPVKVRMLDDASDATPEPFAVAPQVAAPEEVLAVQEMLEPSRSSLVEVLRGLTVRTVAEKP